MRTRPTALSALGLAALLVGCSSGADSGESSAPDASGSAAATSAGAPKSDPQQSSPKPAATDEPSASESTSGGATSAAKDGASASSKASGGSGDTVTPSELTAMAKKLGCPEPQAVTPPKDSPSAKSGTQSVINCQISESKAFILATFDAGKGNELLLNGLTSSAGQTAYYLHGDNWMVFGTDDPKSPEAHFPKKSAEEAKRKIGRGEIASTSS